MNKIIQIVKIIAKYSWLLPFVQDIIKGIYEGIQKARKDGEITGKEVALIVVDVLKRVCGIFDVEDGIDDEVVALIEKKISNKPIKIRLIK